MSDLLDAIRLPPGPVDLKATETDAGPGYDGGTGVAEAEPTGRPTSWRTST